MGRKKKLKKGIESLEKQNGIHKDKIEKEKSRDRPNEYVIAYWEKERERIKKTIEKKKKQASKKKGGKKKGK